MNLTFRRYFWKSGQAVLNLCSAEQGGNLQKFLGKFLRFFVTLRGFYGVVIHKKIGTYDLTSPFNDICFKKYFKPK